MSQNRGGATWIAALIVAVGFVAGSAIVAGALNRASTEIRAGLDEVKSVVADTKTALLARAVPAAAPQPARRRGPDPDKRYEIAIDGSPKLGPDTAKVTIVEFSDFQCPFCKRVGPTLQQVQKEYGDQVQIVWKHMPLSFHAKAPAAHKAAVAAHKQGRFWEMHDKIFENQREMSEEKYVEWAGELGLDVEQFKKDVASADAQAALDEDMKTARSLEVSGTPAFFVNGRYLSGAQPFDAFKQLIEAELKRDS